MSILILAIGCSHPEPGPAGPPGPRGATGAQGATGPSGNGAYLEWGWFDANGAPIEGMIGAPSAYDRHYYVSADGALWSIDWLSLNISATDAGSRVFTSTDCSGPAYIGFESALPQAAIQVGSSEFFIIPAGWPVVDAYDVQSYEDYNGSCLAASGYPHPAYLAESEAVPVELPDTSKFVAPAHIEMR